MHTQSYRLSACAVHPCIPLCVFLRMCAPLCLCVRVCAQGWEVRCRRDWGICEPHPTQVPRLETGLLATLPGAIMPPTHTPTHTTLHPFPAQLTHSHTSSTHTDTQGACLQRSQSLMSPSATHRASDTTANSVLLASPRHGANGDNSSSHIHVLSNVGTSSNSSGVYVGGSFTSNGGLGSPRRPASACPHASLASPRHRASYGGAGGAGDVTPRRGSAGGNGEGSLLVGAFSPERTSNRWQVMAVGQRMHRLSQAGHGGGPVPASLWRLIYQDRAQVRVFACVSVCVCMCVCVCVRVKALCLWP